MRSSRASARIACGSGCAGGVQAGAARGKRVAKRKRLCERIGIEHSLPRAANLVHAGSGVPEVAGELAQVRHVRRVGVRGRLVVGEPELHALDVIDALDGFVDQAQGERLELARRPQGEVIACALHDFLFGRRHVDLVVPAVHIRPLHAGRDIPQHDHQATPAATSQSDGTGLRCKTTLLTGILAVMNDRMDKDARVGEDIRLLGRLLGDTIRAYEGEEMFARVEEIRQLAVASRRLEDVASRERLSKTLDTLSTEQAVAVVRAFSYFSLLANIAEDRHHLRRHRDNRRQGAAPLQSTLPALIAEIEDAIAALPGEGARPALPAVIAVDSWVGGDRDGNPFVTAEMLEVAFRRHGEIIFEHYLAQVHALGAELPLAGLLARVTPELAHLAEQSPDRSLHRQDEPYRRALTGIYARLDATALALGLKLQHRMAVGTGEAYASAGAFAADLDVIDASLKAGGSALLADGRLRRLRTGIPAFGFHLATVDLRQNSDVHEAVVAELLREAGVAPDYRALAEEDRQRILLAELSSPRALRSAFADYSELARGELAIFEAAAATHQRLGREAIRQYVISKTDSVSDLLEVAAVDRASGARPRGQPLCTRARARGLLADHPEPRPRP